MVVPTRNKKQNLADALQSVSWADQFIVVFLQSSDRTVRIAHFVFFFNDTATTEIYTLSLHDALPISSRVSTCRPSNTSTPAVKSRSCAARSEEHTSELQSRVDLVCRLLLEKKKK